MQTFKEYVKENHPEVYDEAWSDWAKSAAIGATMLGASMDNNVQAASTNSTTSPDAKSFLQAQPRSTIDNVNHWNSEIGKYTTGYAKDGSIIYQSKNGNFKRVPSQLSPNGFKFIKI